jgi:hypothetical protein
MRPCRVLHLVFPPCLLALWGCAPAAEDEGAAPSLALGQGSVAFTPLEEDRVEVVFGPQGGWHVEPAVRGWGLDVEGLVLGYDLVDEAGGAWAYSVQALLGENRVVALDDGGWERVGDRLVLDITSAEEVIGRQLTLGVRATPAGGDALALDTLVTLVDDAP